MLTLLVQLSTILFAFTSTQSNFNHGFAIVFASHNIAQVRVIITRCIDTLTCVNVSEEGPQCSVRLHLLLNLYTAIDAFLRLFPKTIAVVIYKVNVSYSFMQNLSIFANNRLQFGWYLYCEPCRRACKCIQMMCACHCAFTLYTIYQYRHNMGTVHYQYILALHYSYTYWLVCPYSTVCVSLICYRIHLPGCKQVLGEGRPNEKGSGQRASSQHEREAQSFCVQWILQQFHVQVLHSGVKTTLHYTCC